MAKKEKLEALVPPEEQPYPVPENWRWVTIGGINIYDSRSILPSDSPDERFELYSVPSFEEQYPEIVSGKDVGSNKALVNKQDVLLCKINPRINRVWQVMGYTENRLIASSEWIVVRSEINPSYLMHCLRSPFFREYMLSNVSGVGGSLMRAQPKFVMNYPIPVPPLLEQQRIVDHIESLFAKLDEAKEKAQAVVDGFEDRKAAILHKAFTGELTETWRKKNKVEISTWKEKRIDEISTVISGYAFDSNDFSSENTVPCIKITNVGVGEYIDGYEYLPENYLLEYHRFETQKGDVLIALTRSYIAAGLKVCINMCAQRALLNQRVALIRDCNTEYLYYYLKSDSVLQYVKEKSKITNQPNLSIKDLCGLTIPYAGAEEQKVIVHELDQLIGKQKKAIKAAHCVIKQIDELKKSILAKAFRGEFGTNDPADPPVELPQ